VWRPALSRSGPDWIESSQRRKAITELGRVEQGLFLRLLLRSFFLLFLLFLHVLLFFLLLFVLLLLLLFFLGLGLVLNLLSVESAEELLNLGVLNLDLLQGVIDILQ